MKRDDHPLPGPGQESVWDYPRPPRLERSYRSLRVALASTTIASTNDAFRVLETSHPPVYYLPPGDVDMTKLAKASGTSFCEFKGRAIYYDVVIGAQRANRGAWAYPVPSQSFAALAHYIAFYASGAVDCFVDDERVLPQPGDFYGGWITRDIVGPFKGAPGTWGW